MKCCFVFSFNTGLPRANLSFVRHPMLFLFQSGSDENKRLTQQPLRPGLPCPRFAWARHRGCRPHGRPPFVLPLSYFFLPLISGSVSRKWLWRLSFWWVWSTSDILLSEVGELYLTPLSQSSHVPLARLMHLSRASLRAFGVFSNVLPLQTGLFPEGLLPSAAWSAFPSSALCPFALIPETPRFWGSSPTS